VKVAEKQTIIPTKIVEGLNINFEGQIGQIDFPISTYETTLFASINRGVKVSKQHPISVVLISNNMTRSIILQCKDIFEVKKIVCFLDDEKNNKFKNFQKIVNTTSNHCKITNIDEKIVGNLIYLRCSFYTDEASGHNMTTIATNEIAKFLQNKFSIKYLSNSGNICCDKKVSAINSISGRGKNVIAEIIISKETCKEILKTDAKKIVDLNIKKNFIGSIVAGSICSANAHYANMLASLYLPFGQDIANIVEGSQGITYCEVLENGDLYFSVNLTNIICGCVGNGKQLQFVRDNLKLINLMDKNDNLIKNASEKMACIFCAVILCGELSLLSALTNQDELVKSHQVFERK